MKRKATANQSGMTLLEVLVAVFVLAIVALPLLNLFVYNTKLVVNTRDMGDTTYATQAVMEDLQPLGYAALYSAAPAPGAVGNYQIRSVANSSTVFVTKRVSIDRLPHGAFSGIVSGTACYAHLIISGGAATFTCPDGKSCTGLSYSSAINITATQVIIGGKTYSLNKPAGTNMILVINAGASAISQLTVNLNGSAAYVLYALSPADTIAQNITVNGGTANSRAYRKYNSATDATADPPPKTMLVNAICKVYKADGALESMAQNILQVNLP